MSSGNGDGVPCLLCGATGIPEARMQRHIELFHSRSSGASRNSCYSCIFCEFYTTSQSQLQSHINAKHLEQYPCPLCELSFPSTCDVETHMAESHIEDMEHSVLTEFSMKEDVVEQGMDINDADIKKIGDSSPSNMDVSTEGDIDTNRYTGQTECDKTAPETASCANHQTLSESACQSLPEHISVAAGAGSYAELSDFGLLDTSLRLNDCPSEQSAELDEGNDLDDFDDSIIVIDESITAEHASVRGSHSDEESNLQEILGTTVKGENSVDPDILPSADAAASHTTDPITDPTTKLSAGPAPDLTTDLSTNQTGDLMAGHYASPTTDSMTDLASNPTADLTAYHNKGARPKVRVNKPQNSSSAGTTRESRTSSISKKYYDVEDSPNDITEKKSCTVIRAESKPDVTYICPLCTFKTKSEGEIQRHFSQEHVLEEADGENANFDHAQYSCPFCAKGFDAPRDLSQHINNRHPEGEIGGGSSHQSYDLTQVPEEWVPVPSEAKSRPRKVEDGFECPVCGLVLENGNEVTLAAHVNEHFQSSLAPASSQVLGQSCCPHTCAEQHASQPRSISKPTLPAPVKYDADWLLSMKSYCHTEVSPLVCHTLQQLGIHSNQSCPYGGRKGQQPYGADCDKQAQKDRDHEMALKLQNEEKRQQQEENKKFQTLQSQFGMDTTMTAKQQFDKDLELAVPRGRLTSCEYHEKKVIQTQSNHSGVDDGSTLVAGILESLERFYDSRGCPRTVLRAYLSNSTHHFSGSYGDKGWGCGYRNFQMILSCLMNEQPYLQVLFNGKPKVPSVQKLQQLLEAAWQKGFDPQGCQQLGGKVVNTRKWIGATEVMTILSYFKVKCQLLDFGKPSGPDNTHPVMVNWVRDYYKSSKTFKPPLYLQHQGHSRCIVGVEELRNGNTNLILFDPGVPKSRMEQFLGNINYNLLQCVRKSINAFRAQQYQIVAVDGILNDREHERSKLIQSTKMT